MSNVEELIEKIAVVCHEANAAWCRENGDYSHKPWDDSPEWQKSSARLGVAGAIDGNTPEHSHESWIMVKVADGWVYGPTKDPERKTHPCLVPYTQLPSEQQRKDALFVAVVRALAGR